MKRLMIVVLTFLLLGGALATCAAAAPASADRGSAQALTTFKEFAKTTPAWAFSSQAEIDGLQLAEPFAVFNVGLMQLKHWQAGGDANALLGDTRRLVYPVISGSKVVGRVDVVESHGIWTVVALSRDAGSQVSVANAASVIRDGLIKSTGLSWKQFFLVQIPALSFQFIGYRVGAQLYLAPLFTDAPGVQSRFSLTAGKVKKGEDYMKLLQPETSAVDPNVPDSYRRM